MSTVIGHPVSRLDGCRKVTGAARYTADTAIDGVQYAVLVASTIPSGSVVAIDTAGAEKSPGVLKVLTHLNTPKLQRVTMPAGQTFLPLQTDRIEYEGQPIAIVVADTLENATHAAKQVRVTYRDAPFRTDFRTAIDHAVEVRSYFDPNSRTGNPDAELAAAAVRLERTYKTADRHHNAMEASATSAQWSVDGSLLVFDTVQGVAADRMVLAMAFGLDPSKVRVKNDFVGGGFGCKGFVWPHQLLAALAAREVSRPIKLVLTRAQSYTAHGYQPATEQTIALAAERDGRLKAIRHHTVCPNAISDDYMEYAAIGTRALYACASIETRHRAVRVNRGTPTPMRAPHEGPGLFALESAMDELAYELRLDPLELRLRNYAEVDPTRGVPFSSKKLRECYLQGARRFGWGARNPVPQSTRIGRDLVGLGMASAIMQTFRNPAKARVSINRQGDVRIETGTQEIGTGLTTALPQIAADVLGVPIDRVQLVLGDTDLPQAPMTAGSSSTLSVGSAIHDAATKLKAKLSELARDVSPDPCRYGELLADNNLATLTTDGAWAPQAGSNAFGEHKDWSMHSYGAVFAEVRIDVALKIPRLTRAVGVYSAGRIINPKTARSQMIGGIIWGLGQALLEASDMDHKLGRYLSKILPAISCQ